MRDNVLVVVGAEETLCDFLDQFGRGHLVDAFFLLRNESSINRINKLTAASISSGVLTNASNVRFSLCGNKCGTSITIDCSGVNRVLRSRDMFRSRRRRTVASGMLYTVDWYTVSTVPGTSWMHALSMQLDGVLDRVDARLVLVHEEHVQVALGRQLGRLRQRRARLVVVEALACRELLRQRSGKHSS